MATVAKGALVDEHSLNSRPLKVVFYYSNFFQAERKLAITLVPPSPTVLPYLRF